MIRFGALWKKEKANGEEYFIGNFGDATLMIYANSYKEADNHPDFICYIGENKRKKEGKGKFKPKSAPESSDVPEDVPF